MKKPLELPEFDNEDEERKFWDAINLADYYEPDDAQSPSFPNLKPTSRSISIRFPEYVLDAVKARANAMGVPYQALIKEAVIKAYVEDDEALENA
ncbi:MAG: BrnA antitoxin family protein [Caldilineales bacterium]|nr:BrnA antitoxin family protein [Caldilineales bacterium]